MERPIPPDALLEHAPFLRSLARHLLRDPTDADDAVQSTWRASLEHPPRRPHALRAWLATVLRNTIRQERRRSGRRSAREHVAARGERVESTADRVARDEISQRIVTAVRALDEPYRAVILMRYYEDLAPRRIAERTGTPVETVKSRLKRARVQLRGSLQASGPDWRLALGPLAGVAPGVTGLAAKIGAAAVSTKLKSAVAVLVVALLGAAGWYALERSQPDDDLVADAPDLRHAADAEPDAQRPTLVAAGGAQEPGAPSGTVPSSTPTGAERLTAFGVPPNRAGTPPATERRGSGATATVEGVVTIGGQPAPGGTVRVSPGPSGAPAEVIEIEGDGTFRIDGARAGHITLTVSIDGRQPRRVSLRADDGAIEKIDVVLGSGSIFGVAHDELGRPAEGAAIRLATHLVDGPDGLVPSAEGDVFGISSSTGPDGRYEFRDLPAGTFVIVGQLAADASHAARDIRSFKVTLKAGETRRLDLGGPHEDPVWSGVVRYADGTPVARSGNVFLRTEDGERRMWVSFDKDGRYSEQVPIGTYRLEFVLTGGEGFFISSRLVQTDQKLVVGYHGGTDDLVFPGARVSGRLSGHDGKAGHMLVFARTETTVTVPDSLVGSNETDVASVVVAADGTYLHDGLLPGTYRVTSKHRALRAPHGVVTLEVPAGRTELDLDLEFAE